MRVVLPARRRVAQYYLCTHATEHMFKCRRANSSVPQAFTESTRYMRGIDKPERWRKVIEIGLATIYLICSFAIKRVREYSRSITFSFRKSISRTQETLMMGGIFGVVAYDVCIGADPARAFEAPSECVVATTLNQSDYCQEDWTWHCFFTNPTILYICPSVCVLTLYQY